MARACRSCPTRPTIERAIWVSCWRSDSAPGVTSAQTTSSATRPPSETLTSPATRAMAHRGAFPRPLLCCECEPERGALRPFATVDDQGVVTHFAYEVVHVEIVPPGTDLAAPDLESPHDREAE